GASGEGGGAAGVGVADQDACDLWVGVQEAGQVLGVVQSDGVRQGVVYAYRGVVEGQERGGVSGQFFQGVVDPHQGLGVQVAAVLAGAGGVAHQHGGSCDVVCSVEWCGGGFFVQQVCAKGC